VPNTELKAVENFGSDEWEGNQIVNYSVHKHEIPTKTWTSHIQNLFLTCKTI
jgi:hypothetical protein